MEAMDVEQEESSTTASIEVKTMDTLSDKIKEIERGVLKKEPRYIQRAVTCIFSIRKALNEDILSKLLATNYSSNSELNHWIKFEPAKLTPEGSLHKVDETLPEVDVFLHLLVLLYLIDSRRKSDALNCVDQLMNKICNQNRRTMDPLAARVYFYYSRVFELAGNLEKIRGTLLARYRICTLRNDSIGQAVLINSLLRYYLQNNLYELADKLVTKVKFPDGANNNEWARYFYYLARIKATRLEYTEAHRYAIQALRKAPESTAVGFRQAANKLAICIELLLGDIPDKKIFKEFKMRNSLVPYLKLTQAVRDGDLINFGDVLDQYGDKFMNDRLFNLILRLRRNVIKTAIRGIGVSYSRISPSQIARKLGLESPEEALYIVAKAIRDGVIEAALVPGYMVSQEISDLYRTLVPTEIYRERIAACLELHNFSVKSMRYPVKKYESKLGPEDPEEVEDDLDTLFI